MAIDSTLFACEIPAGTYAVGDKVVLGTIRGPSIVRDGYGPAYLKKVFTITDRPQSVPQVSLWKVTVKNSNWVDEVSNPIGLMTETSLAETSAAIQRGHRAKLTPNSGWQVVAECIVGGTETAAQDFFCLIDVDYPSVAAVENPIEAAGEPITIDGVYTVQGTAIGSANTPVWNTFNVDVFKAGYRYLLVEASFRDTNAAAVGFFSISAAAGQSGLERIIPCRDNPTGMRYLMDYSTPLVKGPMNINIMSIGTTGTFTPYLYMDFVKRTI